MISATAVMSDVLRPAIKIGSFQSIPSVAETTFRDLHFEISSNVDY